MKRALNIVILATALAIFATILGQLIGVQRHLWIEEYEKSKIGADEYLAEGWVIAYSGDITGRAHWYVDETSNTVIVDEFYLEKGVIGG